MAAATAAVPMATASAAAVSVAAAAVAASLGRLQETSGGSASASCYPKGLQIMADLYAYVMKCAVWHFCKCAVLDLYVLLLDCVYGASQQAKLGLVVLTEY